MKRQTNAVAGEDDNNNPKEGLNRKFKVN